MDAKSINATLARALGVDAKTVNELNSALAESLKDCATQLDSVSLPGFGTFTSSKHAERVATEPDGRRYLVPPSIELSFRSSVIMRKRLTK